MLYTKRYKPKTITKHISRKDDADRLVGHFYSWLEDYCMGVVGETSQPNVLFIEDMGLAGKSAFLQVDVKNVFESKKQQKVKVDSSLPKPLFIYIDYDEFDHAPTETEVLRYIRRSLAGNGINVPLFDYALWLYGKKTNNKYEEVELPNPKSKEYAKVLKRFVEKVNAVSSLAGFVPAQVLETLKPIKDAVSLLAANFDAVLHGYDKALFDLPTSVLLRSLPCLMLCDIQSTMFREHEGLGAQLEASARGICLCFDAVERRDSGKAWEAAFAESRDVFAVFSGRTIPRNIKKTAAGRAASFSLNGKSCGDNTAQRLLKEQGQGLEPEAYAAIEGAIERYGGSVGFASLCITTALQDKASASKLGDCLSAHMDVGENVRRSRQSASFQKLIDDVLDIQLDGLPGDQVQALCVAAWFGPVAPRTICRLLPMIQAHSYAMSRNMSLPYITELDGDQSGKLKIHSLVAHLIRLKCDPITIDNAINSLCNGLSPEVTMKRTEDERMVLGAICRLQSGRVLQELGERVDANETLKIQEVIEGGRALEDWKNLVTRALDGYSKDDASSKEIAIKEVSELLVWLLRWNEARRVSSDYQEVGLYVGFARKICEFWTQLVGYLNDPENGVGTPADHTSCELMQSEALVRYGAMLSDEYRATSKIEFHIEALDNELHAFEILIQHRDKASLKGQCGSLNSLAVSTQRIMHYEYSLPFHEAIHALVSSDTGGQLTKDEKLKFIRNHGAALYSCACDIKSVAVSVDGCRLNVKPGCELSDVVKSLANQACAVLDKAGDDWAAQMTKAECKILIDEFAEAEEGLCKTLALIESGGQSYSDYWMRCHRLLARCLSDAENKSRQSLVEACKHAWLSLMGTVKKHGEHHVDVDKDVRLVGEIKARMKADVVFAAIVKETRTDETDRCLFLLEGFDAQEQEVPATVPYQLDEGMTERLNRVVNNLEKQHMIEQRVEDRPDAVGTA